jgi:hypothetical protein
VSSRRPTLRSSASSRGAAAIESCWRVARAATHPVTRALCPVRLRRVLLPERRRQVGHLALLADNQVLALSVRLQPHIHVREPASSSLKVCVVELAIEDHLTVKQLGLPGTHGPAVHIFSSERSHERTLPITQVDHLGTLELRVAAHPRLSRTPGYLITTYRTWMASPHRQAVGRRSVQDGPVPHGGRHRRPATQPEALRTGPCGPEARSWWPASIRTWRVASGVAA